MKKRQKWWLQNVHILFSIANDNGLICWFSFFLCHFVQLKTEQRQRPYLDCLSSVNHSIILLAIWRIYVESPYNQMLCCCLHLVALSIMHSGSELDVWVYYMCLFTDVVLCEAPVIVQRVSNWSCIFLFLQFCCIMFLCAVSMFACAFV